jgi:hypothetical protein
LLTQPKAKVLASPARDPALTLQDELVACQVKAKFLVILHTVGIRFGLVASVAFGGLQPPLA